MIGIDDRSDDVAAEGRTDLVEQVRVLPARLGILVVADHQLGAVGRQAAVEGRRHARREVASHGRGAEQDDLGLFLPDQAAQHGRVGQRAERSEGGVVGDPHRVRAVFGQLLLDSGHLLAQHDGFEFHPERAGQFAPFGQKFEAHVRDGPVLHFDIYEYVVHLLCSRLA